MCKIMQSSYPNFQVSILWEGAPPPPSVVLFPRFGPMLTNPGYTTVTGIAKWYKPKMPQLIGIKEMQLRGWSWCMLYFIFYPLVMAFNVQENAVFIPKFSEISLCPLPVENHSYLHQWIHSFKPHHNFCSYRIRCPTRNQRVGGGGGGGERHERPPFFSASKIAKSYKS